MLAQERFLDRLLADLWARYRGRVEHARSYEALVARHGAAFVNDHVAFRTFAARDPQTGIFSISRLFERLGYSAAGRYDFPDKHLSAIHLRHRDARRPKIFISELKTWELSPRARRIIAKSLKTRRAPPTARALAPTLRLFRELPWEPPQKKDVEELDRESQYAAWVLVNGYDVNHFTASVDSHGVPALSGIEKTVAAMKKAGVPMKAEIEGARGSKLRQSSTEAVVIDVAVKQGTRKIRMPWTYAYFEIAERPLLPNPETGKPERFQGFLGGQAANLFDMTRR